jgi:hypothetical protein
MDSEPVVSARPVRCGHSFLTQACARQCLSRRGRRDLTLATVRDKILDDQDPAIAERARQALAALWAAEPHRGRRRTTARTRLEAAELFHPALLRCRALDQTLTGWQTRCRHAAIFWTGDRIIFHQRLLFSGDMAEILGERRTDAFIWLGHFVGETVKARRSEPKRQLALNGHPDAPSAQRDALVFRNGSPWRSSPVPSIAAGFA